VTLLPPSFPDVSAAAHTHYRPESARCRDLTNATHFAEHQTARIYIIAAQAGRLTVRVVDIVVSGGRVTDCHCRRRLVTGRSRSRRSLGTRPRNQEARHESSKLKGPNSAQALCRPGKHGASMGQTIDMCSPRLLTRLALPSTFSRLVPKGLCAGANLPQGRHRRRANCKSTEGTVSPYGFKGASLTRGPWLDSQKWASASARRGGGRAT
jgi:hypothetical protein